MADAVERACRYVEIGIRTAPDLGTGSGPINHFHAVEEVTEYAGSSLQREDWTGRLRKAKRVCDGKSMLCAGSRGNSVIQVRFISLVSMLILTFKQRVSGAKKE